MSKAFVHNTHIGGDSIQITPNVLVWGVPFTERSTYGHWQNPKTGSVSRVSVSKALEAPNVVLVNGVIQASVSTSKKSHTSQLQVQCVDENNEYVSKFAPGDWFFCSMFTDKGQYEDVLQRLSAAKPSAINGVNDGLKFVGRVQSVRRVISVNPVNGMKVRRVIITAIGFSEFDAAVYYDPALTVDSVNHEQFYHDFLGSALTSMRAINTTDAAMPILIGSLMGTGPFNGGKIQAPQGAFNIPTLVGKLLGAVDKEDKRSHLTYSAILVGIFGIQKYSTSGNGLRDLKSTKFTQHGFLPDLRDHTGMRYKTTVGLRGEFANQLAPLVNVPIWGVLQNFLMPTINEMYTCLRVDGYGRILPHFIARQIPFNTDKVATDSATKFLTLPRWKIESEQVLNYDIVRSNVLRCNYVQVKSQPAVTMQGNDEIHRALVNPAWDPSDISRNGLNPLFTTTNNLTLSKDMETSWTNLVADRSMDGHLKFTGQVTTVGIQDPICEGDNLEYDSLVFHIEGVQHSFFVNPSNGAKQFTTTMLLSNGVPTDGSMLYPEVDYVPGPDAESSQPQTTLD